jgi:hypothetical protein
MFIIYRQTKRNFLSIPYAWSYSELLFHDCKLRKNMLPVPPICYVLAQVYNQ